MAAHHFVLAGTEWMGTAHKQSHGHGDNVRLLKAAQVPQQVRDAWDRLEILRAGNIYGAKTNGQGSASARTMLAIVVNWATAVKP